VAAAIKKTASRLVRWFKQMAHSNKKSYRWYDVDNCGM